MRFSICIYAAPLVLSGSAVMAGTIIPLPGAGAAGPLALVAAIGAVGVVTYLRGRRK